MERVDTAVIGAGVVGLAAAARLARGDRTLVVLEEHPRYGVETSSRNSEVLHGGIYYRPGSLKARLCHEGRRRIYTLCSEAGIFHKKTGKLVAANGPEEESKLQELLANGEKCGAEGLTILDGAEARGRLPWLRASAALWVPESGIVDTEELMRTLYARACDAGAMFLFRNKVTRVERRPDGHYLEFGAGGESLLARNVINAAGLRSDRLAEMAGIDVDAAGYRIEWWKGTYFRCRKSIPLPHLVYPVPSTHGLGIHMTPDRRGEIRFGPDARRVRDIDYDIDESLIEVFHASVSRYWPDLKAEDMFPDTSGIRPKLSGKGGFKDFIIREESDRGLAGWVNLIGIESPGLTAAPAIAEEVARLIDA